MLILRKSASSSGNLLCNQQIKICSFKTIYTRTPLVLFVDYTPSLFAIPHATVILLRQSTFSLLECGHSSPARLLIPDSLFMIQLGVFTYCSHVPVSRFILHVLASINCHNEIPEVLRKRRTLPTKLSRTELRTFYPTGCYETKPQS